MNGLPSSATWASSSEWRASAEVRVAGHEQDRDARPKLAEPSRELRPVHVGHHHVGEEEVDPPARVLGALERLAAVAGLEDGEPSLLEGHAGERAHAGSSSTRRIVPASAAEGASASGGAAGVEDEVDDHLLELVAVAWTISPRSRRRAVSKSLPARRSRQGTPCRPGPGAPRGRRGTARARAARRPRRGARRAGTRTAPRRAGSRARAGCASPPGARAARRTGDTTPPRRAESPLAATRRRSRPRTASGQASGRARRGGAGGRRSSPSAAGRRGC